MSGLILSLFPGIGLLDMAFEEEGFCVVRGPDLLWGGQIKNFHPPAGRFDGVIGGPPCQAFSRLRFMVEANGYQVAENFIPEFERCIAEAQPTWYLMENVEAAPRPCVPGYGNSSEFVRDVWVGGETNRLRCFSLGTRDGRRLQVATMALHSTQPEQSALASGGMRARPVAIGGNGKPKRGASSAMCNRGYKDTRTFRTFCRLQGLGDDFDLPPFTVSAKVKALGNGVPLPMGRAVARAVKVALKNQDAACFSENETRTQTGFHASGEVPA